ncbi:hypothetical protein [Chitinophaga eiseniae]|uniref:GLPGLI family protein n=1 Tax=Chitinophaga eiseniae TaxID=634771 RepID=A0A847SHZ8_9BACT|nr:hypothetical protein [Chitinophaga eiseniae]NLR81461.1 hypothetical protein [Chitinophaga eiseniae]
MMKRLFVIVFLQLGVLSASLGQSVSEDLKKKNVSDTILQNRNLVLPGTFDGQKALLQLFPGQHYKRSTGNGKFDELINWECKTCKGKPYLNIYDEGSDVFPFPDGVATRLMNVMDFKDSSGMQYKVMSFNHSEFDPEGFQVSRFTGGILGLAKFVLTDGGWKLRMYQPVIGAYGAFSQCPTPKPLLIGNDQYAFLLKNLNGGAGGPFDGDYYLIGGINGGYQQIMAAYGVERTEVSAEENMSAWTSTYTVPASDKKYFRDIVITLKGTATADDTDRLPEEVKALLKGKKKIRFTAEERYAYKGSKGYELQSPVKAALLP